MIVNFFHLEGLHGGNLKKFVKSIYFYVYLLCRNPNKPRALKTHWPRYTADRGEYLRLGPNVTVKYKLRPAKMALWNEYLLSLQSPIPTTATSTATVPSETSGDNKGMERG